MCNAESSEDRIRHTQPERADLSKRVGAVDPSPAHQLRWVRASGRCRLKGGGPIADACRDGDVRESECLH